MEDSHASAEQQNSRQTTSGPERHPAPGTTSHASARQAAVLVDSADSILFNLARFRLTKFRRWFSRSVSSIDTSLRIRIEHSQASADPQKSLGTSCREERHPTRGSCGCISTDCRRIFRIPTFGQNDAKSVDFLGVGFLEAAIDRYLTTDSH